MTCQHEANVLLSFSVLFFSHVLTRMHSGGLKKLLLEFSVFINYSGAKQKKLTDKTCYGFVINSKNRDVLLRVVWTVVDQPGV